MPSYTAAHASNDRARLLLVRSFIEPYLAQFESGLAGSLRVFQMVPDEARHNQIVYYRNCIGCVKKMFADIDSKAAAIERKLNGTVGKDD